MKGTNKRDSVKTSLGTFAIVMVALCTMLLNAIPLSAKSDKGYLVATDYMKADGKTDVTDALQRLIDNNPNRTIFFPDGIYNISRSILTPADPKLSVTLILSNYARLQAVGSWEGGGAVVRLGASHKANDINTPGSNYQFTGGIVDGGGVADGISIDGGRETRVSNVSIKHTRIGIHIKHGANSGSSDSDINDVNIVGNNHKDAIGVLVEGYDNTMTNMRIASVNTGVWLKSGGNSLRNIHPLYIFGPEQDYASSCGFRVEGGNNWLYYCYSDQLATGFSLKRGVVANLTDCFCWWYTGKGDVQTAIECDGPLESLVTGIHIGFHKDAKQVSVLKAALGGHGRLIYPFGTDRQLSPQDVSANYITRP